MHSRNPGTQMALGGRVMTSQQRGSAASQRLGIGLLLSLSMSLSLLLGCQSETAKWNFAQGRLELATGNVEAGLAIMERAVEQLPDPRLKLELAVAKAGQGSRESIRLCDEVLNQPDIWPDLEAAAWEYKANCHQELGEFETPWRPTKNRLPAAWHAVARS